MKNRNTGNIAIKCFFILMIVFTSCSPLKKLQKYKGKNISVVENNFGKPTTIIPSPEGDLYVYEKTTELRGTEIGKGQTTLDPMISPAASKTEKITFTVADSIIVKVSKYVEYDRK